MIVQQTIQQKIDELINEIIRIESETQSIFPYRFTTTISINSKWLPLLFSTIRKYNIEDVTIRPIKLKKGAIGKGIKPMLIIGLLAFLSLPEETKRYLIEKYKEIEIKTGNNLLK